MASPADHPRCLSPAGPWCDALADVLVPLGSLRPGLAIARPLYAARPSVGLRAEVAGPVAWLAFCPFCGCDYGAAVAAESTEARHVG